MEKIGETSVILRNGTVYSANFTEDKAYIISKNTNSPLTIIDLSNEKHPKIINEIEILDYGLFIEFYDNKNLIGVKALFAEDLSGDRVINGMEVALFDISSSNEKVK